MANTLKFGNGQWATKDESVLAYNDENNNFKPLPFDFERGSTATRINKEGLIETVGANEPRIDYKDDAKGALKLEPSRTNLIAQSQAFGNSYWTKSGASIEGDASTAGSELITNGDFATDTDWNKGTGITYGSNQIDVATTADGSSLEQTINTLVVGKLYKIEFEITNYIRGRISLLNFGGNATIYESNNGVYTYYSNFVSTGVRLYCYDTPNFSIDNVSIKEVQGFASPSADSPLDAFKLVATTNDARLEKSSFGDRGRVTQSVWVKSAQAGNVAGQVDFAGLDIAAFTATSEWQRVSSTTSVSGTSARFRVRITNSGDELFVFGAQLEQGGYPTSLINTQGTVQTRLADVCNNGGNDQVINSSEGVFYIELTDCNRSGGIDFLGLYDSSNNQAYTIFYYGGNYDVYNGSAFIVDRSTTFPLHSKIAINYNATTVKVFINGTDVTKSGASISSNTASSLHLRGTSPSGDTKATVKDLRIYKTALTSEELQTLTTI